MTKKVVCLHEVVRLCDDPSMPASLREDLRRASAATIKYDKDKGLLRLKASIMEHSRSPPEGATQLEGQARTAVPAAASVPLTIVQANATVSLLNIIRDRDVFETRFGSQKRAVVVAAAAAALVALVIVWFSSSPNPALAISMSFPAEHAQESAVGLGRLVKSAHHLPNAAEPAHAPTPSPSAKKSAARPTPLRPSTPPPSPRRICGKLIKKNCIVYIPLAGH